MPLIVVTGLPSSGKSTIVSRLTEKFEETGKEVYVVRDEDYGSFSRDCYNDPGKEKDIRGWVRSEVQQKLTKNRIVICDALNYIKGYRYELFLAAKMSKTTYAVIQCSPSEATCRWLNSQKDEAERYRDEVISQLFMRYEAPDTKFRWEKPLFEVKIGTSERALEDVPDDMSFDLEHPSPRYANIFSGEIVEWINTGVELKENQSTQVVPLAPTNYLHELDRATQEVVTGYLNAQKTAVRGQKILIEGAEDGQNTLTFTKVRSPPELNRLRHQYISMSKTHPITDRSKIITLFVDFLNSNLR